MILTRDFSRYLRRGKSIGSLQGVDYSSVMIWLCSRGYHCSRHSREDAVLTVQDNAIFDSCTGNRNYPGFSFNLNNPV